MIISNSPRYDLLTESTRRATALRLLDKATELADEGNFDGAEVLVTLSQEHMQQVMLDLKAETTEDLIRTAQEAMLAANDPCTQDDCTCGQGE